MIVSISQWCKSIMIMFVSLSKAQKYDYSEKRSNFNIDTLTLGRFFKTQCKA